MPDSGNKSENEARLNLLYEIGRVLASAETMTEAAPQILEAICRNLRLELGELWRIDGRDKILRLENVWHFPDARLEKFVAESRRFRFASGDGLPGKVWAQNAPVWIEDIGNENNLPRKFFAGETGLQSAFGFPIMLGEKLVGVFSFFSRDARQPDETLLQMFAAVGNHIGQFAKRERVESSLRESDDRYRAFIAQSTEGIWRFELDEAIPVNLPIEEQVGRAFEFGYLAECNDAMARMYGLQKAEELVGSRISDLLDKTDSANVEYVRAFIESGYNLIDAQSHEKDKAGNGKFFFSSLVGTIENGNLVRVWGTQRDITEQKRAERAVLASEESYRIVAETASDAIIKIDADSRVLFVNHSVERIFGYRVEEMLGQSLTMIMPEDLREMHRAGFRRYLETGVRHLSWAGIEIPARHKDGQIFPLEISFGEYNQNGERFFIGIARDISERKRAEEISERYRLLSSKARDIILFLQPDGKIVEANRAAIETYGYDYETLLEMNLKDLRSPETWHLLAEHLERANAGGVSFETVHRRKDGTTFPAEVSSTSADVGGEHLLMSIIRDITNRRKTEKKVRESEANLRLATGAARMYSWELDLQTQKTRFSENFSQVVGLANKISEMDVAESYQKLIHPDDAEKVRQYIERAAKTKGSRSFETRLVNPENGEIIWIEATSYTIREDDGTPVRIVGVAQNITERKHAQESLIKAERKAAEDYQALLSRIVPLGQILGTARDLISVYRAIFEFVRTSMPCSAFFVSFYDAENRQRIAAYAWGEGVEVNIEKLPPMPITETGGANSQAILNKKTVITNHYWDAMKNRPHVVVQENGVDPQSSIVVPMLIKDEVVGTLEVQAHENEAFNQEQAVALEMAANLAAVAIENVRLLEVEARAREIAERANHAKDEFIALVSHELRSPLNAMLGWTRILQSQKPDEKTMEYALDVIVRNARAQSKLIEDLLDIARVGEGKLRLEMQPTELAPIINAAVEIIKPAAEIKNITITESLDRAANFITGDADRLRQAFENLLSNAVKFTPAGGAVDVRLERDENSAKIIFSDNGQGISAEFLPQIFERFKQADLSTTRRHGGLGIGLSLAQDLVELHGGTISAQSAGEGTGATFTVALPLRMVSPIAENSIENKVADMNGQGKLSGFWILAVDDESDAREIVSFMLQINGAKVTTANSAVEALDILKNSTERLPDILLSDISMPNESGYALLEKIRALPEENGGQIPAVALTAFNRPEDRQSAFDAGFQKHLGKPVEMDDLISAIIETAGARQ